jgi:hypothetical protein
MDIKQLTDTPEHVAETAADAIMEKNPEGRLTYGEVVNEIVSRLGLDTSAIGHERQGGYKGVHIFEIPTDMGDFVASVHYGSCAVCDTMLAISDMRGEGREKALRRFALNVLQSFERKE